MTENYESKDIKKNIEENFIFLMVDFYEVQVEFLSMLIKLFKDLDKAYILLGIIKKTRSEKYINFYQNINADRSLSKFIKNADKYKMSNFKVIDIANDLNLPKETVRRKISELSKLNILIVKKNNLIVDWSNKLVNQVFDSQINITAKFLSKFSIFYSHKKSFAKSYNQSQMRKFLTKNSVNHFHLFLSFQLQWQSILREKFKDMDYVIILLLCSLNNFYKIKKESAEVSKISFVKSIKFHDNMTSPRGLNATTISELCGIPRSTILRKIKFLLNNKLISKDKNNLYSIVVQGIESSGKNTYHNIPLAMISLSEYIASAFNNFK